MIDDWLNWDLINQMKKKNQQKIWNTEKIKVRVETWESEKSRFFTLLIIEIESMKMMRREERKKTDFFTINSRVKKKFNVFLLLSFFSVSRREERRVYDYFTNKFYFTFMFFQCYILLFFHLWKFSQVFSLSLFRIFFSKIKLEYFQWILTCLIFRTFHSTLLFSYSLFSFPYRIFQIIKYSHADGK